MREKPASAPTRLTMTLLLLHINSMGGVVHKRSRRKFIKPTKTNGISRAPELSQSNDNAVTPLQRDAA